MASIVFNKMITELTSDEAQVIVCTDDTLDEFKRSFPTLDLENNSKGIKLLRSSKENRGRIIARVSDIESSLSRISEIKNMKSIAFPLPIGSKRHILEDWAKSNPKISTCIVDEEYSFLKWLWKRLRETSRFNQEKLMEMWRDGCEDEEIFEKSLETPVEKEEISYKVKDIQVNPTYKNLSISDYIKTNTPKGWEEFFKMMLENDYIDEISNIIFDKAQKGEEIYPPLDKIFNAFEWCSPDEMKVIILGQDPYHTPGAAMGLCFSTPDDRPLQPSVKNIFKELESDGFTPYWDSGNLTFWAGQGVFLINTALTVKKGEAFSHGEKIWGNFTGQLFRYLNDRCDHLVIIMWGNHAQKYDKYFSSEKHKKLTSSHPSPLSVNRGFFGSRPFSKTNRQLELWGKEPIDWSLAEE